MRKLGATLVILGVCLGAALMWRVGYWPGFIAGAVVFLIGTYVNDEGDKRRKSLETCAREALKQLRELGYVDCLKVEEDAGIPAIHVRNLVARAQLKGWVPQDIEIK